MSVIQLYSSPYIVLEYHSKEQLIHHTILQPIGRNQIKILKEALNTGTEAISDYNVSKWLSDDQKNGPLPAELEHWGTNDWIPRTINAGWKYWANVVPIKVHAAKTLLPVIDQLHKMDLEMEIFYTVQDARAWLRKK